MSPVYVLKWGTFPRFWIENYSTELANSVMSRCWWTRDYDLVVFDEITYVINYGFIPLDEVLSGLKDRRPDLHVRLTGRAAPPELNAVGDIVTEMQAVKHPYRDGVSAQKGIEF
jgi:cob(I)alamin adenosyltransferase